MRRLSGKPDRFGVDGAIPERPDLKRSAWRNVDWPQWTNSTRPSANALTIAPASLVASYAEADMHKGEKPNIVAGAYTNSVKGTKETALFNIDGTIGGLIKQAPPNDGVLAAIGKLGIKPGAVAFDIWSDGAGKNEAWLMAGDTLYSVDLSSGKATEAAKISGVSGAVKDIAILKM